MTVSKRRRSRLLLAALLGVALVFGAFAAIVTVRYRDGLEQRLRADLRSGAITLRQSSSSASFKAEIDSLAAEGISVELAGITAPGGTLRTLPGALLTIHEPIPINGRSVTATLAGSLTGIDRQVHSLEITELIAGGVVAVVLIALARALVLLDRAVSEARRSEAAMRGFLADASHELRTPVAALHATAERLLREQPARPDRDAIEAQLARDSGRLGQLVDDLLNLARLDAHEQPSHEAIDLGELAAAAAASAVASTDTGAQVQMIGHGPAPTIGDREALLRVVVNLLDNAVAVADKVVVEVTSTPAGPRLSVTDNGPGVPADQRERIFEPFVRLAPGSRRGTGLGLAIVRRTVQAHGGTVICEATASGARFTVRLPAPSTGWSG